MGMRVYCYAPMYTNPHLPSWITLLAFLPEDVFNSIKTFMHHVWLPPQMGAMINKLSQGLESLVNFDRKTMMPIIKELISEAKLNANAQLDIDLINSFPISTKPSIAILNWMQSAQIRPSSPGFPWTCSTKQNGDLYGQLESSNTPLIEHMLGVAERILKTLGTAIGKHILLPNEDLLDVAWGIGKKLYTAIHSQRIRPDNILINPGTQQSIISSLSSHIVWTLSSGHVKPVSYEDVLAGKPTRAIYQSPGTIRLMMARTGQMISDAWEHKAHLPHFGWQAGGAQQVVEKLFSQLPSEPELLTSPTSGPEFGALPEDRVQAISCETMVFATPDISGQDQQFHPEFFQIAYSVLKRDFVLKILDERRAALLWAFYGFYNSMEIQPKILTNAGVSYTARWLNPSGGNLTSAHSQNHGTCVGKLGERFDWRLTSKARPQGHSGKSKKQIATEKKKDEKEKRVRPHLTIEISGEKNDKALEKVDVKFAHVNKGDDMLHGFKCNSVIGDSTLSYQQIQDAYGYVSQSTREFAQ
jgi:hypothetical protein